MPLDKPNKFRKVDEKGSGKGGNPGAPAPRVDTPSTEKVGNVGVSGNISMKGFCYDFHRINNPEGCANGSSCRYKHVCPKCEGNHLFSFHKKEP